MSLGEDRTDKVGVQFFGNVTASISHEIKNVMAVINENAGLIEDLALMDKKGRPLDVERVRILAGKIKNQVRRGDGIIKNMNRFAHSIDTPVERVDLCELLELMIILAQRLASMKGVTLETFAGAEKIMITTRPFILENLIWFCLMSIMDSDPLPKSLTLTPEPLERGGQILFKGLLGHPLLKDSDFFKQAKEKFMEYLKCDLVSDLDSGDIIIVLPVKISGG